VTQFTETYTGFTPFGQIKETVIYPDGVPNVYDLTADANGSTTSSYVLTSQVGTYTSSALDVASGIRSNTITFTTTGPDTVKPNITSLNVNQTSISPGGTFTFSYTISDRGGSGLNRAELFRTPDSGGRPDASRWAGIKSNAHSGDGPVNGTFTDSLSTPGTYWYGLHAVDGAGNTAFEPDPPGPIRVTVSSACTQPSITTNPSDQSVTSGQQATLSVVAAGSGPLSYQWYQGSSGITSNPVSGATSSSLTVQPSATTSYWVRVSNSCGSANSGAATVFVNSNTLPDLTISATVASGYASGQSGVQIPVTVSRSGASLPTTSPYVLARLYWSSSPSFGASAVQLWQSNSIGPDFPVSTLNSSGSRGVTATVTLPAVTASGTYYIFAYVDPPTETYPGGFFSESNESNNIVPYQVSVTVTDGPFVTISPSSGPQQTTRFVTSGTGFTPNGQVRRFLIFPNTVTQEIAGTTASASGQFTLSFTSDCSSTVGTYGEYFIDVATNRQSNTAQQTVTASAGCNAPAISISPQTGPQLTTTFNISGSGFTPNGAVRRLVVSPDGVTREATGTTANGQGQISISSATDCATAAGSYTVWMVDSATGRESTRAQEVVAASEGCALALSLLASPQTGPLGTAFNYTGSGFTRSGTATLSITRGDGQPGNGGKYNTDAAGNVSFVVTALSNDPAGTWTMRLTDDATGRQTSTTVQYTSTQPTGTDVMYYTASSVDVTVPDNTQLAPGETRQKVWRLQNAGTNTWSNYRLVFVPGTVNGNQSVNLSGTSSVTVNASPGQWVNTPNLPVTAPPSSGTYYSYWQMQNGSGVAFGARIYVKIRVVAQQNRSLSYGSRGGQLGTADSPKSKSAYNADPVNTATGNYNFESSDLRMAGRGLGLEFGRAYNSLDATGGPVGRGWSHSFNIYLTDTGGANPLRPLQRRQSARLRQPVRDGRVPAELPGLLRPPRQERRQHLDADEARPAGLPVRRRRQTQLRAGPQREPHQPHLLGREPNAGHGRLGPLAQPLVLGLAAHVRLGPRRPHAPVRLRRLLEPGLVPRREQQPQLLLLRRVGPPVAGRGRARQQPPRQHLRRRGPRGDADQRARLSLDVRLQRRRLDLRLRPEQPRGRRGKPFLQVHAGHELQHPAHGRPPRQLGGRALRRPQQPRADLGPPEQLLLLPVRRRGQRHRAHRPAPEHAAGRLRREE
jgi:hypothetical protein